MISGDERKEEGERRREEPSRQHPIHLRNQRQRHAGSMRDG
jgi:hypothetical protein